MKKVTKTVTIELLTEELGTVPKNPDIFTDHMTAKIHENEKPEKAEAKIEEEISTLPKEAPDVDTEKGWTGFHEDEHGIFIFSHMVKGYLKSAIETCMENGSISKIVAYKKWVDRLIFPVERRLYFSDGNGKNLAKPDGYIERSLRAMTPRGERVALVKSDYAGIGRQIKFTLHVLENKKGIDWKMLDTVFEYGELYGLGQWRGSGGYGQFKVVSIVDA